LLQALSIQNIALIDKVDIEFESGLNIMSGETGAGKSIIVDSVNLILGSRGDRDLIKHGEQKAHVEALICPSEDEMAMSIFDELGIERGDIVISRELSLDGKNVCRINGRLVSLSVLRDVATHFITIHGQNQHTRLLDDKFHLDILDNFAAEAICGAKEKVSEMYSEYVKAEKELKNLEMDDAEKERMLDMLSFQINEIKAAALGTGEDAALLEERALLQNAEKVAENISALKNALNGRDSALEQLSRAVKAIEQISGLSEEYAKLAERLNDVYYTVEDINYEVADKDGIEFDPARLEAIEDRLALISSLKRKYGSSIEAILGFLADAEAKFDSVKMSEEKIAELRSRKNKLYSELIVACDALTAKRKAAADEFAKEVTAQLLDLSMKDAAFEVRFEEKDPEKDGADIVAFYISVNKGEPVKPLVKVVSGGEASRVMLAIKNISAAREAAGTLIFDEIDTGIGGVVALGVADKLENIAKERQVICVTHLPQIAAAGNAHFFIEKHETPEGRTQTTVRALAGEDVVKEVARLSGGIASEAAIAHARELIER